ncbi:MAG: FG-GAP-like repeat-containing protein [bacterium]
MRSLLRIFTFILTTAVTLAQVPTITSFSPRSGPMETMVTIQGTNFSTVPSENIVYFGGVRATVTSATSTSLGVAVPPGAMLAPVTVTVGGLTAASTLPFITTFAGSQSIDNSSFAPKADFSTQVPSEIVHTADLNSDGKLDIITSYNILRNTSSTALSFAAGVPHTLGLGAFGTDMAADDFDGDGKLDLWGYSQSSGFLYIARNTSSGDGISFTTPISILISSIRSLSIGDLDFDGKPDILVCAGITIGVYRNTSTKGSISFAPLTTISTWITSFPSSAVLSDLDNDGKNEVVVSSGDNSMVVFKNSSTPGNFSFPSPTTIPVNATGFRMTSADLDNDGTIDLMLERNNVISVLRNTTTPGSFSFAAPFTLQLNSTAVQNYDLGDLNGDGKIDLVIVNQNDVRIILNKSTSGNLSFSPVVNIELGVQLWPFGVAVGDFDNDGRSDIASANKYSMSTSVFRNVVTPPPQNVLTITSVSPLSGPIGTTVTITGSNFNVTPLNNVVYFGATRATVVTASSVSLTVTVPLGATHEPITLVTNGMMTHSASEFNVTFPSQNVIHTGAFFRNIDIPTAKKPIDMVVNDFDNNGKSDIALIGRADTMIQIFRNTSDYGTPPFTKHLELPAIRSGKGLTDFFIYSLCGGDVNSDGKLDLIAICYDTIVVYPNTSTAGSISFGTKVSFPAEGIQWGDAALGDLDADGKLDLAVIKTDATLSIMRNLSSGSTILFGSPSPVAAAVAHDIKVIDLDADGRPEIIVRGGETNIQVFRNTSTPGAISFASPLIFTTDLNATSLDIADINNDGKQDIVVACWGGFSVFLNSSSAGTLSLAPKQTITPAMGIEVQALAFSDIDGDGKPDMVVTWYSVQGYGSFFKVLKNTSSGSTVSFSSAVNFMTPDRCNPFFVADLDNDSKPDILIPNPAKNTFSLYWNTVWPPQISKPVIQSISPTTGQMGTKFTITGSGFDPTPTKNNVYFGGARAEILTASPSTLYMRVPAGAFSGPVTVTQYGLTAKSSTPFQILLPGSHGFDSTSFNFAANLTVTYNNVSYPYTTESIKVADFNCDGKLEVMASLTTTQTHQLITWLNAGIKDSLKFSISGSGGMAGMISINDYDGDGRLDIATGGLDVCQNISQGQESVFGYVSYLTGNAPKGVASGDFDDDGKPDIATVDNTANILSVFRNTSIPGTISFEKKIDYATGSGPYCVAVGDLTGDGKLDIAVTNRMASTVSLYRNTSSSGTISFASKVDLAAGTSPWGVEIADINNDGIPDLVVACTSDRVVTIYRNLGSGSTFSFAPRVSFTAGTSTSGPLGLSLADLDGDGKLDIGVAISIYNVKMFSLFRNISTLSEIKFESRLDFSMSTSINAYEIALADVDLDGKVDVLYGGYGTGGISIFKNMLPVVVGVEQEQTGMPAEFRLEQNYPNPFNPATFIRYQLPAASRVSIKIFNVLGQEVATLVNGEQDAGSYSIQWNATAPSGIYFCQMRAWPATGQRSGFVKTNKMVLLH